jgi:hypothetical protein
LRIAAISALTAAVRVRASAAESCCIWSWNWISSSWMRASAQRRATGFSCASAGAGIAAHKNAIVPAVAQKIL